MKLKRRKHNKKYLRNKASASTGTLYLIVILLLLFSGAMVLIGGQLPQTKTPNKGSEVAIISSSPETAKNNLQLYTFKGATLTPSPQPTAPAVQGNTCIDDPFNEEPGILYASDPALGGVVGTDGQVRIWVWEDDGNGGSVAPGTEVDPATGIITKPGDRTAADRDGYLWEPSMYLTRLTEPNQAGPYAGDKANGGQPYFPTAIKGVATPGGSMGGMIFQGGGITPGAGGMPGRQVLESAPIDDPVNILVGRTGNNWTFAEFIWDAGSLNLTEPGYYRAQIILHDGDTDLAIICTTIQKK